jgi:hypothetical protein
MSFSGVYTRSWFCNFKCLLSFPLFCIFTSALRFDQSTDLSEYYDFWERGEPDRFVVANPVSWNELRVLRPAHMGKCWVHIPICMANSVYSGIGDEFEDAYEQLGVGENKTACLSRAQYHWELCGSNPFQQVIMTFLPSEPPSSTSFPDDLTVEQNLDRKHGFFRLASWMGTDKVGMFLSICRVVSPEATCHASGQRQHRPPRAMTCLF